MTLLQKGSIVTRARARQRGDQRARGAVHSFSTGEPCSLWPAWFETLVYYEGLLGLCGENIRGAVSDNVIACYSPHGHSKIPRRSWGAGRL